MQAPPPLCLAVVVRVAARLLGDSVDDVSGNHRHDDRVVDRALLETALARVDAAHRAFFDLPQGLGAAPIELSTIVARTVTELCVVDDDIAEGPWALFLHVAPIEADAAPSRPLLAPLVKP